MCAAFLRSTPDSLRNLSSLAVCDENVDVLRVDLNATVRARVLKGAQGHKAAYRSLGAAHDDGCLFAAQEPGLKNRRPAQLGNDFRGGALSYLVHKLITSTLLVVGHESTLQDTSHPCREQKCRQQTTH